MLSVALPRCGWFEAGRHTWSSHNVCACPLWCSLQDALHARDQVSSLLAQAAAERDALASEIDVALRRATDHVRTVENGLAQVLTHQPRLLLIRRKEAVPIHP